MNTSTKSNKITHGHSPDGEVCFQQSDSKGAFFGGTPVARPAALTAQLTAITHTAPGTPDYAIQDLINSSAYGFVTKDEGNSVLAVIKNLQVRVAELEAKLANALNLIAPNS